MHPWQVGSKLASKASNAASGLSATALGEYITAYVAEDVTEKASEERVYVPLFVWVIAGPNYLQLIVSLQPLNDGELRQSLRHL